MFYAVRVSVRQRNQSPFAGLSLLIYRELALVETVESYRECADFLDIAGEGYVPAYTRTELTNHLHGSAGFRTDTQIVTRQKMRSIIAQTKKREKDDDGCDKH